MVYDCFTFFNELDLLEIRLNILKDVVDRFVLVEAGETHTGKRKPFYFAENRNRFAAFLDRIIYVSIESFPTGHDAWWNENYQRNEIMKGLTDARDDDRVMISDLDEIPNPELVAEYATKLGVWSFNHVSYGFFLNMVDVRCRNMHGTKLLSVKDLRHGFDGIDEDVVYNEFLPRSLNEGTTVTKIRRRSFPESRGGEQTVHRAGWHFTCLGGAKSMLEKMRSVAPHRGFHPDDPNMTEASVMASIQCGKGIGLKMNCFAKPVDDSLPKYIQDNQERYAHLIFPASPAYMRKTLLPRLFRAVQGRIIQFVEWAMPGRVHDFLHVVRVKLIGDCPEAD